MSPTGNSAAVYSTQNDLHRGLLNAVRKHAAFSFARPIADYSRDTFRELQQLQARSGRAVILDAGCGTGDSTRRLAIRHPQHLVIGMDKSAARLAKPAALEQSANCYLVRANLVDLWRLMAESNWRIDHHYLLYPNPWPKAKHLKRRWHGHPVFRTLLDISSTIELRTNWRIYAEEFRAAIVYSTGTPVSIEQISVEDPLSPFELKYRNSGHKLFRVMAALGNTST